jgi:hypothetical protein
MSPRRPELRRLRNLIRRRRATPPEPADLPADEVSIRPPETSTGAPPPSVVVPERVPQLPAAPTAGAPRIGRVASGFHDRRLAPWEIALHPNRIAEIPAGLDVVVIDASSTLSGSVWAGWGGPAGATMTQAVHAVVSNARDAHTVVVFRWDLGPGSHAADSLRGVAATASVETAAPGSDRTDLVTLPYAVGDVFIGRERRGEGLGVVPAEAFEAWADPIVPDGPTPTYAVTAGAAGIADPAVIAGWFDTIRTLALPQPPSPQAVLVAAEAATCGVTLDDDLSVEILTNAEVLDRLLAMAGTTR